MLLFTQKITAIRNFVKNVCFDTLSSKFLRALSVLPNITDIAAKRKEKREREREMEKLGGRRKYYHRISLQENTKELIILTCLKLPRILTGVVPRQSIFFKYA